MSSPTQEKLTLMRYIELLEEDDLVVSRPSASCDQRIEFATDDSRQVRPGTLFVCKGRAFKREYLVSAIAEGAVAYVSEVDYDVDIPAVIVNDIRRTLAVVADAYYGHPSGKVKVCAFTGTRASRPAAFICVAFLPTRLSSRVVIDLPSTRVSSSMTVSRPVLLS